MKAARRTASVEAPGIQWIAMIATMSRKLDGTAGGQGRLSRPAPHSSLDVSPWDQEIENGNKTWRARRKKWPGEFQKFQVCKYSRSRALTGPGLPIGHIQHATRVWCKEPPEHQPENHQHGLTAAKLPEREALRASLISRPTIRRTTIGRIERCCCADLQPWPSRLR
ncbi:hypothetical protein VTI74DRAFT_1318 [Chaetomium olivicolor]